MLHSVTVGLLKH